MWRRFQILPALQQMQLCQPTHVGLVPDLGTSKIVHLKVVGLGLEMRNYRDIRGTLTFYFITNVLSQKQ